MTREEFKLLSAGQFCFMNIKDTIDKDKLLLYLEGAMFAYDYVNKMKNEETKKIPHNTITVLNAN